MSEITLEPRPALPFPPLGDMNGALRLTALPQGRLIQALAPAHGTNADLADRLTALVHGDPRAVRAYAPGQWFLVGESPLAPGEITRLAQQIGGDASLSDQSHGRVRVSLEGPAARRVLAKGTAVDLGDTAFPIGRSAQTLFGHIGIHITRVAPERFELIVLRSFAVSLWDELTHGSAEFRGDVHPSEPGGERR